MDDAPAERHAPRRRLGVSTWKSLVRNEARRIRLELELAKAADVPESKTRSEAIELIGREVARAEDATTRGTWRAVLAALTGADIEEAWAALHAADALLFLVCDDPTVLAKLPGLLADVQARFGAKDARRTAAETLLDGYLKPSPPTEPPPRPQLQAIRQSVSATADDAHSRLRNFRNVALAALVILAAGAGALATDAPSKPWLPITHGAMPWATVWQIELVGAVGGLLAGVTALRSLQGFAGPYGVPIVMALLKVPTGALTGLLGALWMQNTVIPGLQPQSGTKILAYVAVFGYAQQAITTFADRQAGQLLGQASGTTPTP